MKLLNGLKQDNILFHLRKMLFYTLVVQMLKHAHDQEYINTKSIELLICLRGHAKIPSLFYNHGCNVIKLHNHEIKVIYAQ